MELEQNMCLVERAYVIRFHSFSIDGNLLAFLPWLFIYHYRADSNPPPNLGRAGKFQKIAQGGRVGTIFILIGASFWGMADFLWRRRCFHEFHLLLLFLEFHFFCSKKNLDNSSLAAAWQLFPIWYQRKYWGRRGGADLPEGAFKTGD